MDEIKPHHWITAVGNMSRRRPPKHCRPVAYYPQSAIDALRAEVEALRKESDWQPIETAPKDGARIMVGNHAGSWVAEYCATYQSGYKPSDPWFSVMLNHDNVPREHRHLPPTHWRPLPTPPEPSYTITPAGRAYLAGEGK